MLIRCFNTQESTTGFLTVDNKHTERPFHGYDICYYLCQMSKCQIYVQVIELTCQDSITTSHKQTQQ